MDRRPNLCIPNIYYYYQDRSCGKSEVRVHNVLAFCLYFFFQMMLKYTIHRIKVKTNILPNENPKIPSLWNKKSVCFTKGSSAVEIMHFRGKAASHKEKSCNLTNDGGIESLQTILFIFLKSYYLLNCLKYTQFFLNKHVIYDKGFLEHHSTAGSFSSNQCSLLSELWVCHKLGANGKKKKNQYLPE